MREKRSCLITLKSGGSVIRTDRSSTRTFEQFIKLLVTYLQGEFCFAYSQPSFTFSPTFPLKTIQSRRLKKFRVNVTIEKTALKAIK